MPCHQTSIKTKPNSTKKQDLTQSQIIAQYRLHEVKRNGKRVSKTEKVWG